MIRLGIRYCGGRNPYYDRLGLVERIRERLQLATGEEVAVGYLTESMHGAGSPQAQRIMIQRLANLEHKKALARRICGIDPDGLL